MKLKISLFIVLLGLLLCGSAYADSGPNIEANQARAIAQDYLNSHNLPYTALTPNISNDWKEKVKVKKTGEVKWVTVGEVKQAFMEENGIYEQMGPTSAWFVHVQDKNGNNRGTIYVNSESGKIISANIKGTSGDSNTDGGLTYTGNGTGEQNSGNVGGILGAIQDFFNEIMSYFQQIWTSIFG